MSRLFRLYTLLSICFLIGLFSGCQKPDELPEAADSPAALLPPEHPYATCLPCHGLKGEGNRELQAPRLAGQSPEYVRLQLTSFKEEWRGADVQDTHGHLMANAILPLDQKTLDGAIDYISQLEPLERPKAALIGRNLARGKYLYAKNCAICHGERGEGSPNELGVPRLDIQYDWYLLKQLKHFRSRLRGFHPDDTVGNAMGFYAQILGNEEATKDVVAWLLSKPE